MSENNDGTKKGPKEKENDGEASDGQDFDRGQQNSDDDLAFPDGDSGSGGDDEELIEVVELDVEEVEEEVEEEEEEEEGGGIAYNHNAQNDEDGFIPDLDDTYDFPEDF